MSKHTDSRTLAHTMTEQIIEWRRDFHMHPEIGFQEVRTSAIVAEELRRLGMKVTTGIGKTGVMGVLGEGKPIIALRADMDALPLQELNEVEYRSQVPNMMHACGHDSHTAILLGVANMLATMKDRPAGQIRFLFQPCEEMDDEHGKSGAYYMVEHGVMDDVDRVLALHISSTSPAGSVIVGDGYISAAVDNFRARIIGKGCHAAHPDEGIDPIFIAAQVINAIHGVRARRINAMTPAVVSLGVIHGGATEAGENVIPDDVVIAGTIRSRDEETRHKLWKEVENAFAVARAFGGDYEFNLKKGCPAVYNDPTVNAVVREVVTDLYGAHTLIPDEPSMGGEDYSYMTQKAPGMMFMLGAKKDKKDRPHHNPYFDLDESAFERGAAILAESTLRLLHELAR